MWIALLLAALLSADRIFHNDYEDGALDVLMTGKLPLPLVAAIKCLAHWLTTGVPLALLAPLLGLLLNLPIGTSPSLVLAMLAGTPAVSFIAGIGASLTLGLRRSGVLLALLVLPLYVPVLIFGVSAVTPLRERAPLAMGASAHAVRAEPGVHRAGADRRRRRAAQCAAVISLLDPKRTFPSLHLSGYTSITPPEMRRLDRFGSHLR